MGKSYHDRIKLSRCEAKTLSAGGSAGCQIDFVLSRISIGTKILMVDEDFQWEHIIDYELVQAGKGNRGNRGAVDELSEANRGDHDRGRRARRSQLIKPSVSGAGVLFFVNLYKMC